MYRSGINRITWRTCQATRPSVRWLALYTGISLTRRRSTASWDRTSKASTATLETSAALRTHSIRFSKNLRRFVTDTLVSVQRFWYRPNGIFVAYRLQLSRWREIVYTIGTCEPLRFGSNSNQPFRFDSKVMGRFENVRIGRACSLLVVVKTQAVNGA